jgi:hypothetical protein
MNLGFNTALALKVFGCRRSHPKLRLAYFLKMRASWSASGFRVGSSALNVTFYETQTDGLRTRAIPLFIAPSAATKPADAIVSMLCQFDSL